MNNKIRTYNGDSTLIVPTLQFMNNKWLTRLNSHNMRVTAFFTEQLNLKY